MESQTCSVNFRGLATPHGIFIFKDAHETAVEGAGNGSRKPCRKVASSPGTGPPPEHAGEAARCHIQMLASTHPDQPARKWDLRRETLDEEWEAFERRLEQYGRLETESL